VFCFVVAWVGCKSVSSYDQLEIEKRKNEQMEQEREHKGWWRSSIAIPLGSALESTAAPHVSSTVAPASGAM
jgi:hypothetical protein